MQSKSKADRKNLTFTETEILFFWKIIKKIKKIKEF